jgi:hypothetical protein
MLCRFARRSKAPISGKKHSFFQTERQSRPNLRTAHDEQVKKIHSVSKQLQLNRFGDPWAKFSTFVAPVHVSLRHK